MKKIKNFPKYFKNQKRSLKRFLKNSRRHRNGSKIHYSKIKKHSQFYKELGYVEVPVPSIFSLVNNTEEMIVFLKRIKKSIYRGRSVYLDFYDIKEVTNDGFIALLSVIQDNKVPKFVKVNARKPRSRKLRKRLLECGISEESEGLKAAVAPKFGRFRQKSNVTADTEEANELIQFATRELYGQKRPLKDVQRILGECIDNTTFHADPRKPLAEKWWGTVFCDSKDGVAYFSILDNGVGIIESLKVTWIRDFGFLLKYKNNAELMRAIFQGAVLSSTGDTNRGNGLPGIFMARERKQFTRLVVITNNVFIDFDKDEYRLLQNSFSGTFFYWEVRK